MKIMEGFLIKGLGGKKVLEGTLKVKGAKNLALKALASSLLFKDKVILDNLPLVSDVEQMCKLLLEIGMKVEKIGKRSMILKSSETINPELNSEISKSFRSSIVLTGPILAREGKVIFSHPGGCLIGKRPIDIFLEAFQKMGANLKINKNNYVLTASKLKPAKIFLKNQSVTSTETLMMTAVLIKGTTVLYNCALEPEIVALADFLNSSGAEIKGAGTPTIVIKGQGRLLKRGSFTIFPDRIEAGSFAVLGGLLAKKLRIENCNPSHLLSPLYYLREMGVKIEEKKHSLIIHSPLKLKGVNIKTHEYPGFPTDLQPPFSVILTQAEGLSMIFETIFEGRLNYLNDLVRMGADVVICSPHRAIIKGPTPLTGKKLKTPDLRAGLAFILAALVARGESIIYDIENIKRGYEDIEERLNRLGLDIKKIKI